ncbi:MAG: metal-dependent transcriptional regulator [Anaerolineales bacterium]|nr:metal-dependent transcriptional regulator [Anaerolineales bacterium]
METVLTQSTQDYLKHIFELTEDGSPASTNDLASRLGIAPASVTGMVQKLATTEPPLVDYRKHQGVKLTAEGERAALEIIRHHRLLESWLVQSLGYSWDEVHDEACRLEHVISEDFEARMAAALGNPSRDPHGDPIPDAELVMPSDEALPLSSLRPAQAAVILRVNDEDPAFLRYLDELGLIPGAELKISSYSPFDNNLTISVSGQTSIVIGLTITSKILVEVL